MVGLGDAAGIARKRPILPPGRGAVKAGARPAAVGRPHC